MKRRLLWLLVPTILAVLAVRSIPPGIKTLEGRAMGCSWKLAHRGPAPAGLRSEVSATLERWEQVMSSWRPDSDLQRLLSGQAPTPDLDRVLSLADRLKRETKGAFDPGYNGELDLSGIGKGFAVDRVTERLADLGIHDFVFELGGEVRVGSGEWAVGIENPLTAGTTDPGHFQKLSLATSGGTYQSAHIKNPANGRPVLRDALTVTVFHPDCATADAWATALFVLGPGNAPASAPHHQWNR